MKKLFLLLTAILCLGLSATAQTTIHGTVVDGANGDPLIGATVMPVGGGNGTSADVDGHFTLNVPSNVKRLKVTMIGYDPKEVAVAPNMTIELNPSGAQLTELVVTGYGSAKKPGQIVGAVSTVGPDQFENVPTATFIDALQGQVAGLSISSNSGDPTADETHIRLRGVNSLTAGNTPLFILDGAPVSSAVFTTLNPSDIESVTVLKDAASVAIYGSRAANGVIVITSKRGKFQEKPRVSLRASYGWSQMVPDKVDMMSSADYVAYRDLIGSPVNDDIRRAALEYGINTDWMKETFDSSAPTYQLDGSVTGGGENLSYYVSLNHFESDGIISQSHMRRESLRFSLQSRVNDWFRFGIQSNLGFSKYQNNNESNAIYNGGGVYGSNPMFFARSTFPFDSPYQYRIGENGKPVFGERAEYLPYSDMITPQVVQKYRSPYRRKVTGNVTLSEQITPIKGLIIRAQQNVDALDYTYEGTQFPRSILKTTIGDQSYTYDWDDALTGSATRSFQRYYAFTYTNTAEYTHTFNDVHNMTVLLGQEAIITRNHMFGASSSGHTDVRQMLLTQGTSVSIEDDLSESYDNSTFNSIFLNGSYNYNDRYFFEATYRRDGSSKFAPGHRWSNFFSVGAMWNAKLESFLAPYTWLTDAKLHVSYGTTGNSSISNYMYYGLVGTGTPYNGNGSIGISQAPNKDLTWETVRSFDVGINFGFLNRINGEVDFYNKETVDMLMQIPYSYTTGYSAGYGNIGNMRNTGVDFNVDVNIINTRDWRWNVRANFNYNHNEITKLFDGQDTYTIPNTGIQYAVGHSAGELYTVRWAGIDPRDGQQMWYDRDGNLTKVYNEEQDAVLLGKSQYAPYSGGFGTDVSWKGLSLKVDFNWAAKKYMTNNDRYFLENNNMAMSTNQMKSMLNVWTHPGQITDIPAADGQTLQFDSHLVEDASYLRLKNLTIQYSFGANILKALRLQALNVHFTGRNLLTFTGYTGYDPEPETNVVAFFYPNTRQYEIGLDVSF